MRNMKQKSKIRVLTLEGPPKERGRIHGENLRPLILEILERYKYYLRFYFQKDPDPLIDSFLSSTNFLSAAKKWSPHLLKEMEGIAEGVGVDFKEIFYINSFSLSISGFKIPCFRAKNRISRRCISAI